MRRLVAIGFLVVVFTVTPASNVRPACGEGDIPCGCNAVGDGWFCCGDCRSIGNSEWTITYCGGCCPPRMQGD